mmetsp:Transcript_4943/g.6559  ORF Transcript_4943/g.6559 Transcript_4943/m.6559 type:complete len:80 (+) Transcript_4943:249-488(+)
MSLPCVFSSVWLQINGIVTILTLLSQSSKTFPRRYLEQCKKSFLRILWYLRSVASSSPDSPLLKSCLVSVAKSVWCHQT